MKLSILDQSPIMVNQTAQQALDASLKLAQLGEELGYTRYWIAEHHDMNGLTSSVPEVMLSYIGAHTSRIRIGAGAVLLPHYKSYKVAEVYNMLATLFTDRIDIGLGRAPGGSAEASIALSGNFLENVKKFPESVTELLHFVHNDFPEDHFYAKTKATPLPTIPPTVWVLGTSEKSTRLAAENGVGYVFGQFMSDEANPNVINTYLKHFTSKRTGNKPYVIVTVSVICAETTELAEELATYHDYWKFRAKGDRTQPLPTIDEIRAYSYTKEEQEQIEKSREKLIIGNPQQVEKELNEIKKSYQADEIMVVTLTHTDHARRQSYGLIANQMLTDN